MRLRQLSQINFRNLATPTLELKSGLTAIVGPNAAGKSNLLSAAYLACSGDLPAGQLAEAIRLGEREGFVRAKLERSDGVITIEVGLAPGRKLIRLDGQTVRSAELAKVAAAVLITPQDSEIVHGPPGHRRSYLDSLLSRLSLRYAMVLREYGRVLEQRNALLKGSYDAGLLAVWSERFVTLGSEIMALRERAVARLSALITAIYREISGGGKVLSAALSSAGESLAERLAQSCAEERARGVTVVGPHRDDMLLALDGLSLQAYGSRGEARTAALALRVAEYRLLAEKHGEAPVLLLDDFSAELDSARRDYLLALAAAAPQALVSGTDAPPQCAQRYRISGGRLYAD